MAHDNGLDDETNAGGTPDDYAPLTPEQAQAAYDAAPAVPLSDERIQEIVAYATALPGPQTLEEARQFHEGFLSGATSYARAVGHSTLKRDNPKLAEVFDAKGWKTVETFEKLDASCEHGVKDGDWCEPCNKAMKESRLGERCEANTIRILDEARERSVGSDTWVSPEEVAAKKLTCANCSEVSSSPGQFLPDGRWVCTESCRKELDQFGVSRE